MPALIRQCGIIGGLLLAVFVTLVFLLYPASGLISDSWLLICGRAALTLGAAALITAAVFKAAEWFVLGREPKQSGQPGHAR